MNRKSIVQILVLILLVAVGAGVYLSQQEGGLDFMMNLVGLGGSQPPKSPPPKPIRRAAAPAPKPAHRKTAPPKAETPAIPQQPASGEIHNAAFTVESADIENGVLTLRQGARSSATEVQLFLKTRSWHVPAERRVQVSATAGATGDIPKIRLRWHEDGKPEPNQSEFADNYTLNLNLGKVKDGKLPGKIYLALPDSKNQIAGTFTADVRGFHFIDGKPDLSSDSVDTLQYLALHEVLKNDPNMQLEDVAFRQGHYSVTASDVPPSGYIEIQYRVGDAAPVARKFQFAKEQDQWRIVGTLHPDQLDAAHPREAPGPKDPPERLFPFLAARKIEAEVQKRQPGALLAASPFATRYNEKKKIGVVDVGYKVGDEAPVQTAFLFRLGGKGWKLERELKHTEKVNLASGKIERR